MPAHKVKQDKTLNNPADEELKTDEPMSEKDEVKQAEERTRKAQGKVNKGDSKDGK